jgi:predicted MFS family arabinose efflux permease
MVTQPLQQEQAEKTSTFDSGYTNRLMMFYPALSFLIFYIELMLLSSLPSIASEFHVSVAQVSLVVGLYAVSGTALAPLVGKLGDIFGKKRILVYVLVIYAAAISVTGFSPNFAFMVVARTVQGVGLAIQPLLISLVREQFPKDKIPRAQGIISGMNGVGLAVALPLGSFVSNSFGWRATFHTAIPFVALCAVVAYVAVKDSPYSRPNVKVDYVGASLLGSSLALIVFALAEGPSWGWVSVDTISLFLLGVVLLVPLLIYELRYSNRGGEPILNLRLLAIRNVMVTNLTFMVAYIGMVLAFYTYIFKFEYLSPAGYGLSIFKTGLSLVPLAASILIFAPLTGWLVSKVGVKRMAVPGSIIATVGFFLDTQASTYTQLLVFLFVVGMGLAMVIASVINLLVLTVDPRDIGLASSMNTVFRNLGNAVGAPITGSILSTFTVSVLAGSKNGSPLYITVPSNAAFHYAFYLAAVSFVAIALILLFADEVLGKKVSVKPKYSQVDQSS